MHALIIEDESLIALAIEEALRECGFTSFDVAISAEEAFAAATYKCPDLITADVELRPGCGIGAVQSICCEQPIPVLFITGRPIEVRTRMPRHALVEKPFSAGHLIAAIKHTLESRDLGCGQASSGNMLDASSMPSEPSTLSAASREPAINEGG